MFDGGKELVNAAGRSLAETSALVRDGAQVNEPSKSHFGWTPLISAVYNHKEDVIDFLLLNGADPNLGDEDDRNALVGQVGDDPRRVKVDGISGARIPPEAAALRLLEEVGANLYGHATFTNHWVEMYGSTIVSQR